MNAACAAAAPHRIQCAEVWGGISIVDTDVCTRGVTASIYSRSSDSDRGGDVYYFSVCGADLLTRIVIADMRGHGAQASELSAWLYESLQAHMNSLDGAAVLCDLNKAVCSRGFSAITTAVVASYYVGDGCLYYSYAGHPPALVRKRGSDWAALELDPPPAPGAANLPLGVSRSARYDQRMTSLEPGDMLFLFTDGVVECADASGEFFGEDRLRNLLVGAADATPHQIKSAVRHGLDRFAPGSADQDD